MAAHDDIERTVWKSKELKARCFGELSLLERIISADTAAQRAALPDRMPSSLLIPSVVQIAENVRTAVSKMSSRAATIRFKQHLLTAIRQTQDETAAVSDRVLAAISLARYCPADGMPDLAGTTYTQMTSKLRDDVVSAVHHVATTLCPPAAETKRCSACGRDRELLLTTPVPYHPRFALCGGCLDRYKMQQCFVWSATGTAGVDYTGPEQDVRINHEDFIAKLRAEPGTTIDGNEFAAQERAWVSVSIADLRVILNARTVSDLPSGIREGRTTMLESEYWQDALTAAWSLQQAVLAVRTAYLQRRELLDIVPMLEAVKNDKFKDRAPWRAKVCHLAAQLNNGDYDDPWFSHTSLSNEIQQIATKMVYKGYGCCVCEVSSATMSNVAKLGDRPRQELEVCSRCVSKYRIPILSAP